VADEAPAARPDNPYSTLLAILGGGVALALVIFAIGFVTKDDGGGGGESASSSEISLTEFQIDGNLNVAEGATLSVSNAGSQVHNLVIDGDGKTADLQPGDSEELAVDVGAGSYTVYCSIAGHREAGMEATLQVGAGGGEAAAGGGSSEGGGTVEHGGDTAAEYEASDVSMMESFQPFVGQITSGKLNTEGLGGQDLEPTILPDGTKEWNLTAQIVDWEVTPGQTVKAWTYNGTVPGPTLRGEVGDRIRVNYKNELPIGMDVHQHGMVLPNDMDGVAPLTQELIPPGGTATYEYTVTEPAIAMYHPHAHGSVAIPDGMWGAMIFSPKGGGGSSDWLIPRGRTISGKEIPADVEPVMDENMVLNDAGVIGLSLNGKGFPATEPYSMKVGDWAIFNYYSEGQLYHTMHLHQFPQLVIARDGIPLDYPYWADTINVGPGERYTVLFQATKPGAWVWHCHILNHAESPTEMIGMVTAVAVSQ
jgi:plastocyanin